MKKKMFAVLIAIALLCACLPLGAVSADQATSGTTGDCIWTLDGTHLTISGNGSMGSFFASSTETTLPWGFYITSVTINYGVTDIGDGAFMRCKLLKSVTIPDSVTTIGNSAFSYCEQLKEVTMGDSVTTIGDQAFFGCKSLQTITIPDSVTLMGVYLFRGCTSLRSATIGDNVTTIEEWTFYECESLQTITIPAGVTTIGTAAFADCYSLADVYYTGDETDRSAIQIDEDNDELDSATWHYNDVIDDTDVGENKTVIIILCVAFGILALLITTAVVLMRLKKKKS